jgi:murein DD-endopeptidase MepM/ murein hydrolase activator NlpD
MAARLRNPISSRGAARTPLVRGVWGLFLSVVALAVLSGFLVVVPAGQSAASPPATDTAGEPSTLTPVVQSVLSPPRWYPGDDGRFHLPYELQLTNTLPIPVDVTEIDVLDGHGRSIAALSGDRLKAAITPLGNEAEQTTQLPGSTVGIAWMDLSFATRAEIPTEIEHRVTIDIGPGLPAGPIITSTGERTQTASAAPVAIGPPLRAGRWVAIVGPHRRALQAVNGALHNSQRFAIDFSALLDAEGRTHTGNPDQTTSYFNYAQPVLAVGDATVIEAVDGLPDQIPNHKVPIPLSQGDGNHVILELGSGIFAGYAHLKPGSIRVKAGEHVQPGQILGQLGNSGESGGPHLHFQLMNRPSIAAADGLPFVLHQFDLDGFTTSLDAFLAADLSGAPVPINTTVTGTRHDQGLTGLEVLSFPDGP